MKFRYDIQGLRALAVIFVFIFHLSNTFLPGGFIGVDMFFVISGYLISKIVLGKINKGSFNLLDFYIGRIKRIVPAYYFLLIAIWIAFLFIFANSDIGKFKLSHFWTVLFNSNNYFGKLDDYFGASSNENPFLHTWTLAVEMQFYFILPLLLLFIRNGKVLIVTILSLTILLFGYSTFEIAIGNKSDMYFSLLSRSPEFFLGVLASLFQIEDRKFIVRNSFNISMAGILGLIVSIIFYNESIAFPGISAALPCLATVCLLVTPLSKINMLLSNRVFRYLGEISYSVYLWHWPIMAFMRYHNDRYGFTFNEIIMVISLTAIASIMSYYFIERPLRKLHGYKLFIPLIILFLINVGMIHFVVPAKFKISNIPPEYIYPSFGIDSHGKDFEKVEVFGNPNAESKRILLLGDSHALTFKPYLDTLGKKEDFAFRTITNDVYPAIPNLTRNEIVENFRYNIYQNLFPYIEAEVDSADVIIIYFSNEGSKWINALEQILTSLKDNQRVLFVSDYPTLNKNPARLNKTFIKDESSGHTYELIFRRLDPVIHKLIESTHKAKFVDLTSFKDFFVDAPFLNDTLMYYDSSHLNYFGSIKYEEVSGDEFMKYLRWALDSR